MKNPGITLPFPRLIAAHEEGEGMAFEEKFAGLRLQIAEHFSKSDDLKAAILQQMELVQNDA